MSGMKWNRANLAKFDAALKRGLLDGAEHLGEAANRTVPHEEGTLQRSGKASQEGYRAAFSYDTPYAVRQHEDTRLRHDPGRRAKWLALTLSERALAIQQYIAATIKRAVG